MDETAHLRGLAIITREDTVIHSPTSFYIGEPVFDRLRAARMTGPPSAPASTGCSRPRGKRAPTGPFPATAARMIRTDGETGTLNRLTAFFGPAIIFAMGMVAGFAAVAMVSARYGSYGQVG